jgi:hypothetical protein
LLEDAKARLQRFQSAISAGVEPSAVVEGINRAQADRAAAQAELMKAGEPAGLGEAEVYAMIDLRLDLRFDHEKEAVDVTASPRVNNDVSERGDLNPHTWDISRVRGDHAVSVA